MLWNILTLHVMKEKSWIGHFVTAMDIDYTGVVRFSNEMWTRFKLTYTNLWEIKKLSNNHFWYTGRI